MSNPLIFRRSDGNHITVLIEKGLNHTKRHCVYIKEGVNINLKFDFDTYSE